MCWCYWPSVSELEERQQGDELKMNFGYTLVVQARNIWSEKRNVTITSDFYLDTPNMNKGNHVNVVTESFVGFHKCYDARLFMMHPKLKPKPFRHLGSY